MIVENENLSYLSFETCILMPTYNSNSIAATITRNCDGKKMAFYVELGIKEN